MRLSGFGKVTYLQNKCVKESVINGILSGLAITGAGVGSWVWWRRPQARLNTEVFTPKYVRS